MNMGIRKNTVTNSSSEYWEQMYSSWPFQAVVHRSMVSCVCVCKLRRNQGGTHSFDVPTGCIHGNLLHHL